MDIFVLMLALCGGLLWGAFGIFCDLTKASRDRIEQKRIDDIINRMVKDDF